MEEVKADILRKLGLVARSGLAYVAYHLGTWRESASCVVAQSLTSHKSLARSEGRVLPTTGSNIVTPAILSPHASRQIRFGDGMRQTKQASAAGAYLALSRCCKLARKPYPDIGEVTKDTHSYDSA